jgi:Leucine Rich repeat
VTITDQNSYLRGIESVLSSDSTKKYIQIDSQSKKCWRTSKEPDDTKVSDIFFLISQGIEKRMGHQELLTIGKLQTRLMYLKSIYSKAQELSTSYADNQNSGVTKVLIFLSGEIPLLPGSYSSQKEQDLLEVTRQHSQLEETIRKWTEKTEGLLESAFLLKEKVVRMKGADFESLSNEEILDISIIAFEHARQEDNMLWVNQHKEFLNCLYSWLVDAVDQGELSYEKVSPIAQDMQQGGLYFSGFWVTFANGEELVKFNRFQFLANRELMTSFLKNLDSDTNKYLVTEKDILHLKLIKEDMTTGSISGYSDKNLDEILDILNLTYFQYDRGFSVETFKILNEKNMGLRLSCGEQEIVIKLNEMTTDAAKIIQHPFIKSETYELNLSDFDNIRVSERDEADRILSMLIEYVPNIEVLWLPVPCAINESTIDKFKSLKSLRVIHLNLGCCVNYQEFYTFFLPLSDALKTGNWKLCLENIDHFKKDEAIKLFSHFPKIQSVSLEGMDDLSDDDVMRVCANLQALESLSLNGSDTITDVGLKNIAEYGDRLTSIALRDCPLITDQGVIKLLEKVGDQILRLDLGGTGMTTEVTLGISDHCRNIESLSFKGCGHITDASVKAIATECKNIKYYDLEDTSVGDDGVKAIGATGNELVSITFNGCIHVTASSIRELLGYCQTITKIDLRGTAVTLKESEQLQSEFPNVTIVKIES